MFKPFYIHYNPQNGKLPHKVSRGFTIKVEQDSVNQTNVVVRGAWCSSQDLFEKAKGRSFAQDAEAISINKRALPTLLANMTNRTVKPLPDRHFYYVLKYVV